MREEAAHAHVTSHLTLRPSSPVLDHSVLAAAGAPRMRRRAGGGGGGGRRGTGVGVEGGGGRRGDGGGGGLPAAHVLQVEEPSSAEYLPAVHVLLSSEPPVQKYPAGQVTPASDVDPSAQ